MKNQNPLPFTASPFPKNLKAKCFWCVLVLLTLALASTTTLYAQEDLFASINGPDFRFHAKIFEYSLSGTQISSFGNFQLPRGLAFDSSGDLFVANNASDPAFLHFHPTVKRIGSGGGLSTLGHLPTDFFPEGLAVDNSGNVFVAANDSAFKGTIFEFTPSGTRSTFASNLGQLFGLAFDSAGNLFAADSSNQFIYKFAPGGTPSVFADPSDFTSTQGPIGLAFDSNGNLFVSTAGSNVTGGDAVLEFTPGGIESTFATGVTSPRGLAIDNANNLYVAEIGIPAPGEILKFTPNGSESVFATGIGSADGNGPQFLAFGPALTPDSGNTILLLIGSFAGLVTLRGIILRKQPC